MARLGESSVHWQLGAWIAMIGRRSLGVQTVITGQTRSFRSVCGATARTSTLTAFRKIDQQQLLDSANQPKTEKKTKLARIVQIIDTNAIRWLNVCATCGTKERLRTADATIRKIKSVRPSLTGDISVKTEMFSLNYPVCEAHAKGLALANTVTGKSAGFAVSRGMVYLLGPLSLLLILMLPLRFLTSNGGTQTDLPVSMLVIYILSALAFDVLIRAYRKLPLRLVKRGDDVVTIKFQNDAYAVAFTRLNQDNLVGEK